MYGITALAHWLLALILGVVLILFGFMVWPAIWWGLACCRMYGARIGLQMMAILAVTCWVIETNYHGGSNLLISTIWFVIPVVSFLRARPVRR